LKIQARLHAQAKNLLGFARFVGSRFREDRCSQVASSLTFTTLLALVPLVTIVLNFISVFPLFSGFLAKMREFILANLLPQTATKLISVYLQQFSDNASRLTALGGFFLAVAALMLIYTIDRTFNRIWRVSRPPPLLQRLLGYAAVLLVWPIFIGMSLTLTSYLVSFSLGMAKGLPTAQMLLLRITPMVLTTLAFALLYYKIPNRPVLAKHALAGGFCAALLFEIMKRSFASYIASFPTYKLIYGAFSSVPIFLLWLYFSWLVILLGAEISASLHYVYGGAWRLHHHPAQQVYDALRVLRSMFYSQLNGKRYLSPTDIQSQVPLGMDRLEDMLDRMDAARIVRRLPGSDHYVLDKAGSVTLAEVYKLFLLGRHEERRALQPADAQLQPVMENIAHAVDANLTLTLEQVFTTT
jgi:membrane protein